MTDSASTATTVSPSVPLKGDELLTKVKDLRGSSPDEMAVATGYVTRKGKPRVADFNHALGVANGYFSESAVPSPAAVIGGAYTAAKKGRAPSYQATVAGNGNAVIGGAYTAAIGLAPGDKIKISVDNVLGVVSFVRLDAEPAAAVSDVGGKQSEDKSSDEQVDSLPGEEEEEDGDEEEEGDDDED